MQRATYAFNKVLADFIVSAKKESGELKNILRKHYRVIDNTCTEELERWDACLTDDTKTHIVACDKRDQLFPLIGHLEVFKDCTLATLATLLPDAYHTTLMTNVYTLTLITLVYRDGNSLKDGDDDGRVLEKVLAAVAASQSLVDNVDSDEILDDDYRAIIQHIRDLHSVAGVSGDEEMDVNDLDMSKIMDSKIGKLAAEISQEIDPSHLDMTNPMDMLNLQKLADGSSPLGEIITKVGGKIQGKLASGELNQGELIAEAMNMLKLFDKNNALGSILSQASKPGSSSGQPSLSDFASMFSNMNVNQGSQAHPASASVLQTRERLRAKLASSKSPPMLSKPHK